MELFEKFIKLEMCDIAGAGQPEPLHAGFVEGELCA